MFRVGFTLAGMAATVVAPALAIATMVPQVAAAGPVLSSPVQLLSGANTLQPVIDQLIDAQQQITDHNSTLPFIVPSDLSTLPAYEQMLAGTMFASSLNMLARNQFGDVVMPWAPYPWTANATDPQPFLTYNNPDDFYSVLPVDSAKTYVITIQPGPGTQDVTFLANSGNGVTTDFKPLFPLDLAGATPNADGSYTITLSSAQPPDTPSGNWVDTAGANTVVVRDTLGDWGQIHDNFDIQEQGGTGTLTLPLLTQDQMSSTLSTIAANLLRENLSGSYLGQFQGVGTVPINTFDNIAPTTEHIPGPLLSTQLTSLGHFSLQPDQALIVKVPELDSAYSSIMLANNWGQTDPWATVSGSLNNTQAFHDPDGFTYYVISSQNPGVANWVNDSGVDNGGAWLRWQNITGPVPSTPVTTQLVDVADVGKYLPADTPVVTPAEYAADFKDRLFDYDYAHDQAHGIPWVGANLMYDQVRTAVGAEQFDKIFGAQTDVPSVADRLTPALSPDMTTVAHDILTNPGGSLSALINNLPLAIKDIELPTILAIERLKEGVEPFGTVLNETFTDPTSGITAGFLNARDDLATAVMNAPSGFAPFSDSAPLWASLSNLNEAFLRTLLSSAGSTAALDPADIASLSADLAPNATGVPLDLLP